VLQLVTLVNVMQALNALFERDRNEKTNGDGRNMNEEILPRVDSSVGRMDIEHGC
jgi:hypothetical protein